MTTDLSRRILIAATGMAIAAATMPAAYANPKPYEGKTVKIIVEFPPGSGADTMGRVLAPRLSEKLGGNFVVESKPGAGGKIAGQAAASAPPDGTTLLMMTVAQTVIAATSPDVKYDLLKDFKFIATVAEYPFFVFTSAKSDYKTLADVIAAAKANPGKLSFSSPGVGTTIHLGLELMLQKAGATMLHVPFSSGQQMITDVQNGSIAIGMASYGAIKGLVDSGQMRVLAVSTKARAPQTPDVPSVAEAGVPDFDQATWTGLAISSKAPPELHTALVEAVQAIMAEPEVNEKLTGLGLTVVKSDPDELSKRVHADMEKWRPFKATLQR